MFTPGLFCNQACALRVSPWFVLIKFLTQVISLCFVCLDVPQPDFVSSLASSFIV